MSDAIKDAISEAEAVPDFDYEAPAVNRIEVLIDQAAGHVMARERLAPAVQAAKLGSFEQHDKMQREMQYHKLAVGRCWLVCKSLGLTKLEFRARLDAHLLKAAGKG